MKDLLLPLLKEVQKKYGFISEKNIKDISDKTGIPVSRVYGVATFYAMLNTEKQGKHVIRICCGPSCNVNGNMKLIEFLKKELKCELNSTSEDGVFSLYEASCIGCCDVAPAMLLDGEVYGDLTEEKIKEIIKKCRS